MESLSSLISIVELLHDSEELFSAALLVKEDWSFMSEAACEKQDLNERAHNRQAENDAPVLLDIEVILRERVKSISNWVGECQRAWKRSAETQGHLVSCTECSTVLNRTDLVDELGADNGERTECNTPKEASNADNPELLADEADSDSDKEDEVENVKEL